MKKYFATWLMGLFILNPAVALAVGVGGGANPANSSDVFEASSESEKEVAPAPASKKITSGTSTQADSSAKAKPASAEDTKKSEETQKNRAGTSGGTWAPKCAQAKLANRVRCRLSLSKEDLVKEATWQYLPEECRPLKSAKQETCLARYRKLEPCWDKAVGTARSACAAKQLGLKTTSAGELKKCQTLKGMDQKVCQAAARDKVYAFIKFRFYDLSERAEAARAKGVPIAAASALVTSMEQIKQSFNQATSYNARRALILKARGEWQKFVKAARGKERTLDYLDQALADLRAVK